MAPPTSSPLLKLFGVDPSGPGHSLQHIRDKIYSHAWSRIRRDDYKLDFVVSETGINRNVPERWISPEEPYGAGGAPCVPPLSCNLHLINKQVSKDFIRYIYNANDLEVDVDLKALHTNEGQVALDKIATLLHNPNFQKYTRTVRVRIHFPGQYSATQLPDFNRTALENIAFALDDFKHLEHLAVRVVPGQGAPLDYELRLATFPFYPMRMTNWSIRILNAATFPYTWDLVDTQNIAILDQAHEIYQQTGSLTASILPSHIEKQAIMADLRLNHKALPKLPSTSRQSTNGSQKRRGRKKKAAEAVVTTLEAPAEAAAGTPEQVVNIVAVSNVQSSGLRSPINRLTEGGTEELLLDSDVKVIHPTEGVSSVEEQSVNSESAYTQVSGVEHSRPNSSALPPLSPAETEVAHALSLCPSPSPSPIMSSLTRSSGGTPAIVTAADDQADIRVQQDFEPSSPAPSSATLVPTNDGLASEHVDSVVDDTGDANGNTAQLKQGRKKRRNKKAKKNKAKSNDSQSNDLTQDVGFGKIVEFEIGMKMMDQEQPETSNDLALRSKDTSEDTSASNSNRFDLSLGTWSSLGATHALFTRAETGISTVHQRNARVDRYLRQQERVLAARAETEDQQNQAKAKKQVRKARQTLLRRNHIAVDSPLSRAMERPRNKGQEHFKPKSRSPSPTLNEELARSQIAYYNMQDKKRQIEEKIRTLQHERGVHKQSGVQHVIELQDGDEREIEEQFNFGRPDQDHHFDFDAGSGEDDDSINSLTQEHPESIGAEDSGEDIDEARFEETVNRRLRPHGLSVRIQEGHLEPFRIEPLDAQPNEELQCFTEDDSHRASEASDEGKAIPDLDVPVPFVLKSHCEQRDQLQYSGKAMAHSPDLEKVMLCKGFSSEHTQVGKQSNTTGAACTETNTSRDTYTECLPVSQPLSRPRNEDGDFFPPVVPVTLRMPSNELLVHRHRHEDSENNQCSAEILALQMTQHAPEDVQGLAESNQRSAEGGQPGTKESQLDRRGGQHERHSRHGGGQWSGWGNYALGQGSYRCEHRGGRSSTFTPRTEKAESPWARAVQLGDREFAARSVERRLALEHDMQIKGKTYTDYATPIEDSYTKLDEDRKLVDEKTEQIVYGPQAEVLSPLDGSLVAQEATGEDA